MPMALPSVIVLLRCTDQRRRKCAHPAPEVVDESCPDPRTRLAEARQERAHPLKFPDTKKPSGNPRNSISVLLIGICVYRIAMSAEPAANRKKVFLRPQEIGR